MQSSSPMRSVLEPLLHVRFTSFRTQGMPGSKRKSKFCTWTTAFSAVSCRGGIRVWHCQHLSCLRVGLLHT